MRNDIDRVDVSLCICNLLCIYATVHVYKHLTVPINLGRVRSTVKSVFLLACLLVPLLETVPYNGRVQTKSTLRAINHMLAVCTNEVATTQLYKNLIKYCINTKFFHNTCLVALLCN